MVKAKYKLGFSLGIVLLMLIIALGYQKHLEAKRALLEQNIVLEIEKDKDAPGVYQITMKNITDFTWHQMYVFPPYTSDSTVNSTLGFRWHGVTKTNIDLRDDIFLFVFVNKNRVVQYAFLPYALGDLEINRPSEFAISEAIFIVSSEGKITPLK